MGDIQFQNGARKIIESTHGVLDVDLLEIVRDRLKGFQSGNFATEYNAKALEYIDTIDKLDELCIGYYHHYLNIIHNVHHYHQTRNYNQAVYLSISIVVE